MKKRPTTLKELFEGTEIEPTIDENGVTHYNFTAKSNFTAKKKEIPTADVFYNDNLTPLENMIEFAKLHVEAALKAVCTNATTVNKAKFKGDINYIVDTDSVLDSYPLTNIV